VNKTKEKQQKNYRCSYLSMELITQIGKKSIKLDDTCTAKEIMILQKACKV
jgi:hypothetical protein